MNDMLNLDDLGLRIGGRAKSKLTFDVARDIDASDVETLNAERSVTAPAIKKLREKHHSLARMLVSGMSVGDAGVITGYSPSRVSILQADPSFKELLRFYSDKAKERHFDLAGAIADLGTDTLEIIGDRLEEDPDQFTVAQLTDLTKMALDRSGFGPSTKAEVSVKVGMADRFEAARKRVEERKQALVIDATAIEVTPEEAEE